jgi:hypothetical protein
VGEKEYTRYLGGDATVRLRVRLVTEGGRVVLVMVQLEALVDDAWHPVVRYDDAHGMLHRDVMDPAGRETKKPLPLPDRESFLAYAEQDLDDRWEWYLDRFLTQVRRRRKP